VLLVKRAQPLCYRRVATPDKIAFDGRQAAVSSGFAFRWAGDRRSRDSRRTSRMIVLHLFAVLALVGVNAFFSAAEFSLVAIRQSRVRQLVEEGDARAKVVETLLKDLSQVVSGVQVGITLASLSLGYLGEITLAGILTPLVQSISMPWAALVAHGTAMVVAFGLLTVLQVVLGELVPKSLSLARAERVALLIARPFYWFLNTFRWAIDLLDGLAERIVRALGVIAPHNHTLVRSTEELQVMIQQAHDRGLLPAAEVKFIQSAMDLGNVEVREVMIPRPDVHALPSTASVEDAMRMFATTQRSRIPVYEGSLDHILGFVHIKDMIWVLLDRARRAEENQPAPEFSLRSLLRDVLIVPETKPVSELLVEFRSRRTGLAMVVDEFGSILGLATLEDILEQMVGEIHDEFDVVERPLELPDGGMIFDAALKVRELESRHNIVLPEDDAYETLGGYVLNRLGFIPRGSESFEADGYRFTVMEMEKRRVSRLKIKKLKLSELPVVSVEAGNSAGVSSDGESAVTAKGAGAGAKPEEKVADPARAKGLANG
jgi:CBS domain containing-hemolysin-like protein